MFVCVHVHACMLTCALHVLIFMCVLTGIRLHYKFFVIYIHEYMHYASSISSVTAQLFISSCFMHCKHMNWSKVE